jgi:hypothetical protein
MFIMLMPSTQLGSAVAVKISISKDQILDSSSDDGHPV